MVMLISKVQNERDCKGDKHEREKEDCTNESLLVGTLNLLQPLIQILLQMHFPLYHRIPKRGPQACC
jgi:hypothetical protein